MCLYPKLIRNRKYSVTKKNGGNVPELKDPRALWVPVGCGRCIECRKQKAREWQTRLSEEIKTAKGYFVTFTFNPESYEELSKLTGGENNALATLAVRRFLERYRKKFKVSCKHWLITELGHTGTERIHLHGILFTKADKETISNLWGYGFTYIGDYCNQRTINYVVKYVTKPDLDHKEYNPVILCSPGIGKKYLDSYNSQTNKYKGTKTNETYRLPNGAKIGLPVYYRNNIYNDNEREKLWLQKLDKQERWVCGIKIDVSNSAGERRYYAILKTMQEKNQQLGYGDDSKNWKREDYNYSWKQLKKTNQENSQRTRSGRSSLY